MTCLWLLAPNTCTYLYLHIWILHVRTLQWADLYRILILESRKFGVITYKCAYIYMFTVLVMWYAYMRIYIYIYIYIYAFKNTVPTKIDKIYSRNNVWEERYGDGICCNVFITHTFLTHTLQDLSVRTVHTPEKSRRYSFCFCARLKHCVGDRRNACVASV